MDLTRVPSLELAPRGIQSPSATALALLGALTATAGSERAGAAEGGPAQARRAPSTPGDDGAVASR